MSERDPRIKKIMIEVGARIRKARKSRKLTQTQVGEIANDTAIGRRLTKYENGEDHMSMVAFFDICKALRMSPADLAPLELFPEGASVIDDFLDLTEEQQEAVRTIIKSLKVANGADN